MHKKAILQKKYNGNKRKRCPGALMEGPGAKNGKVTGWDSLISQRKIQCDNREVWRTLITVAFVLCPVLE